MDEEQVVNILQDINKNLEVIAKEMCKRNQSSYHNEMHWIEDRYKKESKKNE